MMKTSKNQHYVKSDKLSRSLIGKQYNVEPRLIYADLENSINEIDWIDSLEKAIPQQNGTPSQVEALKKSIERGKGL